MFQRIQIREKALASMRMKDNSAHLAAVDGVLERPLETHVVISMEVCEEVGTAVGNGAIPESIYSEGCAYSANKQQ